MQTVKTKLSDFLTQYTEDILAMCQNEGFAFSLRKSEKCVTVECRLPDASVRYIIFNDHREHNPHGEKPHVCNQWHKSLGKPLSFIMGEEVADNVHSTRILSAAAIMCITQTSAYKEIKEALFV